MKNLMLYLNFENRVYEYHLPAVNNRRLQVNLAGIGVCGDCMLELEVWDGHWYAKSSPQLALRERDQELDLYELKAETVLDGYALVTEECFSILVMPQDRENVTYKKYFILNQESIRIGSDEGSELCIHHAYISRSHAQIYQSNGDFYIQDNSKNGTFVNNERLLSKRKLEFFDEIYIVGIKLVFLGDILTVNHESQVSCSLPPIHMKDIQGMLEDVPAEAKDSGYFSRSPRMMEPLAAAPIELEGPPAAQHEKKQPLLFILGPSVTMPIPIMMSVLFNMNMNSGGSPMMYLGTLVSVLSSAGIGAGWTLAHQRYDKKQNAASEKHRVEGYRKYIEKNEELLKEKHDYNRRVLEKQYLPTAKLCRITGKNQMLLWNRNINHEDFLTIRLGTGKVAFPAQIVIPRERFTLEEDELAQLPFALQQRYRYMENAVSTLKLQENKLIGVVGDRDSVLSVMKTMVVQVAALHCYTEVKMAFLTDRRKGNALEWIRWLPHFFSGDKGVRYIADDEGTCQNVLYALEEELRNRQELAMEENEKQKQFLPHYLVFCTEAELMEKESIYSYMVSEQRLGFTFVLLYERMDRLPNECVRILQWDKEYQGSYLLNEVKNQVNEVNFDKITDQEAEDFARSISGIYVNEAAGGELPVSIDFMEMMQIPKLESWDLMKRYKENRVYEGIKAMVGLTYGNRPMYLDIHEKKFGPHGLVAGTTGSGKSETLMTFILSLAMNYHPSEVAFVLIDYKGGGMAAPFIGMPHLAGTITNIGNGDETESIDESQTRRALVSIRSEIRRRQKIFSKYKLNHIDAYIRLYREGQAEEPLPHLIIISDEFAELKKEQPEFIKELVSTARVGRSLGIHLILATQKPGGVVDDEIWSNSRFKICLRVQDKQDSMGMLKRPEAAYITGIGRAYLQIGNDEVFELFQSGYAGAMYEPQEEMELSQHSEVSMIGLDGSKLVSPVRRASLGTVSQLDACVAYIAKIAEENGIPPVRPLWLPSLPERLYLEDLEQMGAEEGIRVTVGLVDDPQLQRQYPAELDLLELPNLMVVGGIGKGKSTFLQTLLYGLVTAYDPETVNLYCMDFSSRTLRLFAELPHCGGVALSEDEEAVERMLKLLVDMTQQRKRLFEEAGVGSYTEYRSIAPLPLALLVIDNYTMFKELYPDQEEMVSLLLREGFKYGIQTVIAANVPGDMNYRMRQNISRIVPLYFAEKGQYTDVLSSPLDVMPANLVGRGLWEEGRVMEFQTALAVKGEKELERNHEIQRRFSELAREGKSAGAAARVRTIPKNETYEAFCQKASKAGMLPIGYNMETLEPEYVDCRRSFCYSVSFISEISGRKFLDGMEYAAREQGITVIFVGAGREINPDKAEDLITLTLRLREEFKERNSLRKEQPEGTPAEGIDLLAAERFGRILVLVDDLQEFLEGIYQATTEEEFIASNYEEIFRLGKGLGICFIGLVRSSSYHEISGRIAGELFLRYRTGIHFGGKLDRQKLMEFELPMSRQMEAREDNIGMWPEGTGSREVFMPWGPKEEV